MFVTQEPYTGSNSVGVECAFTMNTPKESFGQTHFLLFTSKTTQAKTRLSISSLPRTVFGQQ
jgi:hypothetical protein